ATGVPLSDGPLTSWLYNTARVRAVSASIPTTSVKGTASIDANGDVTGYACLGTKTQIFVELLIPADGDYVAPPPVLASSTITDPSLASAAMMDCGDTAHGFSIPISTTQYAGKTVFVYAILPFGNMDAPLAHVDVPAPPPPATVIGKVLSVAPNG